MDPVSHMLFAGTLSGVTDQPPPRGVTAALVLGSILPDIDMAAAWVGVLGHLVWDRSRPRRRSVAAWTLVALAVVLGGKAISQSIARHQFRERRAVGG